MEAGGLMVYSARWAVTALLPSAAQHVDQNMNRSEAVQTQTEV